jgi:hypothetical protein
MEPRSARDFESGRKVMSSKLWASYEEVAVFLLDKFAAEFGLGLFEGKQVLLGATGTSWEIDAKGVKTEDGSFVVVECKRYSRARVHQEVLAGLSYRIQDVGGKGGIIVTPIGMQYGASKVAAHEGIIFVQLGPESTRTDYVMHFLKQVCVGIALDHLPTLPNITAHATVTDQDGNVLDHQD